MTWNPFNDFPREIGYPARKNLVWSMPELIQTVNLYNKRSTIFTSLYAFDKTNKNQTRGIYNSARIRQIYYDIDTPKTIEPVQILHEYCLDQNYLHCFFCSGGGFHTYIATKYPNNLKNKKGAVTNAQIHIADELRLKIGVNNGEVDIDGHIIGNVAQLVRVPGSYNLKRKLYCVPVTRQDLQTDLETIQKKARKQIPGVYVYGKEYLDLAPFDSEPVTEKYEFDIVPLGVAQGSIGIEKINVKTFPPCIKSLTEKRLLSHRERYILIIYCRELGLLIADTIALLQKFLDPKTLYHCLRQEKQPYWCYRRTDLMFPSCETLKAEGLCTDQTCQGAKLYG